MTYFWKNSETRSSNFGSQILPPTSPVVVEGLERTSPTPSTTMDSYIGFILIGMWDPQPTKELTLHIKLLSDLNHSYNGKQIKLSAKL